MKALLCGIIALALLTGCAQPDARPTAQPTATSGSKQVSAGDASAQGYIMPVRHADLAFRIGGRVAQILVAEGDQIQAGQPLIRLQDSDLRAVLAQAQADLKGLQNGARPEEIAAAQADVDIAGGQLEVAQAELDRLQDGMLAAQLAAAQADAARATADLKVAQDSYRALVTGHGIPADIGVVGRGLGTYEENQRARLAALQTASDAAQKRLFQAQSSTGYSWRAAQANVDIAAAQRSAAQARLDLLTAGATPEQIEMAQSRVAQAQAALDEATLVAPFDGTIAELTVQPGEIVGPAARVASIADLSQWEVETDDLSEVDVVSVHPGVQVSITVDALPGVTLKGQVTAITPRSIVKRGDVTYTVKVTITESDPRLKWGMTASVDIHGD